MIIDTVLLEKGLKAAFDIAYETIEQDPYAQLGSLLATFIPSNSTSEKYGWLGDLPAVKEWLGDKISGILKDYDYTILNKNWYTAIDVHKNEIADDQLGRLKSRIEGLAQTVRQWIGELVADFLIAGTASLAYDGQPFYGNIAGNRVNDNLLGGSGIATLAAVKTDIATARATMMKFVGDSGRVLNIFGDTIVCAPEAEEIMLEATGSASTINVEGLAIFNPIKTWIKNVIVCPKLPDANDWYFFCTTKSLKPFIYQSREDAHLVLDETALKRAGKYTYSAEMRGNAGYGFPQMAIKMVNG